jgi:hypothetical protein
VAKRVSLKGKGADIFFGDYAPPGMSAPESPAADAPVVDSSSTATSEKERSQSGVGLSTTTATDAAGPIVKSAADRVAQLDVQTISPPPKIGGESKQASKNERVLARKPARMRVGKQRGVQASSLDTEMPSVEDPDVADDAVGSAGIGLDVWTRVDMPATITNSFRYTEAELSTLTDVLYEIGKQHGAKLTKQDVARLGLNVILDEYRRRGADSLLGKLAARRRQRRGGGS